jgi:hypothetical protein
MAHIYLRDLDYRGFALVPGAPDLGEVTVGLERVAIRVGASVVEGSPETRAALGRVLTAEFGDADHGIASGVS